MVSMESSSSIRSNQINPSLSVPVTPSAEGYKFALEIIQSVGSSSSSSDQAGLPTTSTLAPETLVKIFIDLNEWDIRSVSLVNKDWLESAKYTAKILQIEKFVEFVSKHLEVEALLKKWIIGQLRHWMNHPKFKKAEGLTEIFNLRDNILKILKILKTGKLEELRLISINTDAPWAFDELFEVAKIYQQLDNLPGSNQTPSRSEYLYRCASAIAQHGYLSKALKVGKDIKNDRSPWANTWKGFIADCIKYRNVWSGEL